jgi:hypothetical protein
MAMRLSVAVSMLPTSAVSLATLTLMLLVAPKPAQELSLHVAAALIDIFALPLELLHQPLFQSIEIGFEDGLVLGRV